METRYKTSGGGAGTGSVAVVDAQTGGIARITTGAVTGNNYRIDWNDIRSLLVNQKATIEVRTKISSTSNTNVIFALRFDANNRIYFRYATHVGDTTWRIICVDGGATTNSDSLVSPDTDYHLYRIECFPTGEVHFYIDGTEVANSPITTNIPDDAVDVLQPYLYLETRENVAKSMDIDYCYIRQER